MAVPQSQFTHPQHTVLISASSSNMQLTTKFALFVAAATSVSARTMTVYNNCPFTIWPAVSCTSATPVEIYLMSLTDVH
jgi:hypothetical protein